MSVKQKLIKIEWFLSAQLGFDIRHFLRSLKGLPVYLYDLFVFCQFYAGNIKVMPCLHDRYEEGGLVNSEYFWQDLLVARAIYADKPQRHVDVGSRVDGLVAHVASFRECEVFDVRPVSAVVPGVVFRQADLMNPALLSYIGEGYCDSLSCLHAIEHFGLGRYGDPISDHGLESGIANMAQLLRQGGKFYLSTPVGQERVEFNANWVFDPRRVIRCCETCGMSLQRMTIISAANAPRDFTICDSEIAKLALEPYSLVLFMFVKSSTGLV